MLMVYQMFIMMFSWNRHSLYMIGLTHVGRRWSAWKYGSSSCKMGFHVHLTNINWDFVNQHVDLSNTPTQEWQECPTKIQYKNTNYYIYNYICICTYIYNMLVQNVNAIGYSDISITQTTHNTIVLLSPTSSIGISSQWLTGAEYKQIWEREIYISPLIVNKCK